MSITSSRMAGLAPSIGAVYNWPPSWTNGNSSQAWKDSGKHYFTAWWAT